MEKRPLRAWTCMTRTLWYKRLFMVLCTPTLWNSGTSATTAKPMSTRPILVLPELPKNSHQQPLVLLESSLGLLTAPTSRKVSSTSFTIKVWLITLWFPFTLERRVETPLLSSLVVTTSRVWWKECIAATSLCTPLKPRVWVIGILEPTAIPLVERSKVWLLDQSANLLWTLSTIIYTSQILILPLSRQMSIASLASRCAHPETIIVDSTPNAVQSRAQIMIWLSTLVM